MRDILREQMATGVGPGADGKLFRHLRDISLEQGDSLTLGHLAPDELDRGLQYGRIDVMHSHFAMEVSGMVQPEVDKGFQPALERLDAADKGRVERAFAELEGDAEVETILLLAKHAFMKCTDEMKRGATPTGTSPSQHDVAEDQQCPLNVETLEVLVTKPVLQAIEEEWSHNALEGVRCPLLGKFLQSCMGHNVEELLSGDFSYTPFGGMKDFDMFRSFLNGTFKHALQGAQADRQAT